MRSTQLIIGQSCFEDDAQAMTQALELAHEAGECNEVPVGAIVLHEKMLIGWGKNQSVWLSDPTAHAEIQALRMAGKHLNNYRLTQCEIFVTLEPCAMCFGAMMHSRVSRVVFAAHDYKTGVCSGLINLANTPKLNHHTHFESGLMAEQSVALLQAFFARKRQLREDG